MVATKFGNISSAQFVFKIMQISILLTILIKNNLTHATYMPATSQQTFGPYKIFSICIKFVDVIS